MNVHKISKTTSAKQKFNACREIKITFEIAHFNKQDTFRKFSLKIVPNNKKSEM